MAEVITARAAGLTTKIMEVMEECRRSGLSFRVILGMAEVQYAKNTTPERAEDVLRSLVGIAGAGRVPTLNELDELAHRAKRCLSGQSPQLNLVDRGAKPALEGIPGWIECVGCGNRVRTTGIGVTLCESCEKAPVSFGNQDPEDHGIRP